MNEIKQEILDTFEEVQFLDGQDDKLVGYAEMFGNDCIPLYEGINYLPFSTFDEAVLQLETINPNARKVDGFDSCVLGHLKLENGDTILLYDKNAIIEQLKKEYSEDKSGIFDGKKILSQVL